MKAKKLRFDRFLVLLCVLSLISTARADWPQSLSPGLLGAGQTCIGTDSAGEVYIAATISAHSGDLLLAKYDRFGTLQWQQTWDDRNQETDISSCMTVTPAGNVYIGGTAHRHGAGNPVNDLLVVGFDPGGNVLFDVEIPNAKKTYTEFASALTTDKDGNILVTGGFGPDSFTFSGYVTAKISPAGALLWSTTYAADQARAICTDHQGNVIVTGQWGPNFNYTSIVTLKYSPTGELLWAKTFDGPGADNPVAVATDSSDGIIVAGTSADNTTFNEDFVVVKYNSDGAKQWQSRVGTSASGEIASAMQVDGSGNVILVGTLRRGRDLDDCDVLTAKLDSDGNKLWSKSYTTAPATNSFDAGVDLRVDAVGNVFVVASLGVTSGSNHPSMAVLKYAANGVRLYVKPMTSGDYGGVSASGIAIDAARGKIYAAGTTIFKLIVDKY